MKRRTKGIIIGACICIGIGFVLFSAASAAGGFSEAKEFIQNGGITIDYSSDDLLEYNTVTEQTISLEDMDKPRLEVELAAGDFEIIESDVKDIVIKSSKKIDISTDGNYIRLQTPKKFRFMKFKISNDDNDVTIQIPKGMKFEDVKMMIGAGEMSCESIFAEKLKMEIGAGTIGVNRLECEKAEISVGAGEIIVDEGDAKDMDLEVGMGSFSLHGNVEDKLDAECGMGTVQLWLEGSQEEHDYDIDCGMGNVTVGDISIGGVASEREINNGASSQFDLECGMGSIEIYFEK